MTDNGWSVPDREEDAAYALVSAALREDPGFELSAGFPDRVALRAFQSRRRFDWFEHVVLPLLLAAPILYLQSSIAGVMQKVLPGVGDLVLRVLSLFPRLSLDGLVYAGASLLFSAVADRLVRRRLAGRGQKVLV
jgi:hypothetical protein